jgi:hypothetical protein
MRWQWGITKILENKEAEATYTLKRYKDPNSDQETRDSDDSHKSETMNCLCF